MFIPNAGESLTVMTGVAEAQREFLRMVEVTARISERRTCLSNAELGEWTGGLVDMAESESKGFCLSPVDATATKYLFTYSHHVVNLSIRRG